MYMTKYMVLREAVYRLVYLLCFFGCLSASACICHTLLGTPAQSTEHMHMIREHLKMTQNIPWQCMTPKITCIKHRTHTMVVLDTKEHKNML